MSNTRASINNFVGIFGRQAPISGLEIPRWVTIFVDHIDPENEDAMKSFIRELTEGCAVVGATGVTVAIRVEASRWYSVLGGDFQTSLVNDANDSRPYFRAVVCNAYALDQDPTLFAGKLIIITDGAAPSNLPACLLNQPAVCIDYPTTMIAKTANVPEVVRDALEQVAELSVRELPHWLDTMSSMLLNSTLALLALNVMCKPDRFEADTFFFASDYLDETIARAFNDRNLRARWRKEKDKPVVDATAAEEVSNA
jgi:hypothetical protein